MAKGNKDDIRSKIFAGSQFKSRIIHIAGAEVELRQPSLGYTLDANSEDSSEALLNMMIELCYVPGTDERVFEDSDKASIKELPLGDWLSEMQAAFTDLTNIDIGEAEKN